MSAAVLEARGLSVRDAAGRVLVDGVDLTVEPGAVLGVVGESGSGKTLTMLACLGLLPAGLTCTAERLVLAGEDAGGLGARERARLLGRRVGYVPQNTAEYLHPLIRVRDQMTDGYRAHHEGATRAGALARARELLAGVGIDDPDRVLAARPGQLSGGMRQRVNIATALMGEPALVVADEPTAALDCVVARQVAELLVRLCRERGTAVALVSHSLGMVRSTCDSLAVMYAGRVVEGGPCAEVFRLDGHPYTRALAEALPRRDRPRAARLADIPGTMPEDGRAGEGCLFKERCPRYEERLCAGPCEMRCLGERRVRCARVSGGEEARDGR